VVPILFAVVIPAVAAGIVLWVLRRFTARAVTIFVVISVVVTVASLPAPFSLDIDTDAQVALAAMHVVTAAAIVGALTWAAGRTAKAERSGS